MKQRSGEKVRMLSVDELLGVSSSDSVTELLVEDIYPFKNHPFKVVEDDKMEELIDSIRHNGVLTPVIVRTDTEGKYEMISGHRRLFAVKKIGLDTIPVTIKEMTDDDAVIAMVDSNIQREEILPSEKAFAYRMRYEAMRHQGVHKTSSQIGTKLRTDEELAKQFGESRNQIHRYIRLTEVIPELLDIIDRGKIAFGTGVEISYFEKKVQKWIYEYIKENGVVKQYQILAIREKNRMKKNLTRADIIKILNAYQIERKPSMRVNFTSNQLRKYFPAYYSPEEVKAIIEQLLEEWKKNQKNIGR